LARSESRKSVQARKKEERREPADGEKMPKNKGGEREAWEKMATQVAVGEEPCLFVGFDSIAVRVWMGAKCLVPGSMGNFALAVNACSGTVELH